MIARTMELRVNGRRYDLTLSPDTPLLFVLRNDLGLKAAKLGCGLEQCGACNVLIDGEARPSCSIAVDDVAGCEITTLEGLGSPDAPHPLQRAFLDENAAQCGYCTAGLIVTAAALLRREPDPDDRTLREALAGNLCRCGAHPRVLRAIRRAAALDAVGGLEP
jgi:aerobic-type carbon monoxide dehydrogenase small subunit (CoxS/CutS family)